MTVGPIAVMYVQLKTNLRLVTHILAGLSIFIKNFNRRWQESRFLSAHNRDVRKSDRAGFLDWILRKIENFETTLCRTRLNFI